MTAKRVAEQAMHKARRSGRTPGKKATSSKKKFSVKKPTTNNAVTARRTAASKKAPPKKSASIPKKRVPPKVVPAQIPETEKKLPRSKEMAAASSSKFATQGIDVGGRITAIVQNWANATSEPASDAVLSTLWANSGSSAPFTAGSQDLAQRLNKDLGSALKASDIKTDTTLGNLIQMIV